jgi:hypothetical protein
MKPLRGETRLHFHSSLPTDVHEDNNLSSFNYYSNIDKPWLKSFILTVDKQEKAGVMSFFDDVIFFTFYLSMNKKKHLPRTCRGDVRS